jgi:hypothetical protein
MDKRGFDRIAQEFGGTTLPNAHPMTAKENLKEPAKRRTSRTRRHPREI